MSAIRPRDLLTDAVLDRLHGADLDGDPVPRAAAPGEGAAGQTATTEIAEDFAVLREAEYLAVALPPEFGGLGCTLRQAACGQRRLAGIAPLTALAVSTHLYWTGAAADAYRSGDDSVRWILDQAARGAIFGSGHGLPGLDLKFSAPDSRCEMSAGGGCELRAASAASSLTPVWDWLAVHALADCPAGQPTAGGGRRAAVLAFAAPGARLVPADRVARVLPAGAPSDVFTTSAVGWGCAVLASVEFSAARRAFRRACDQAMGVAPSSRDPEAEIPVPSPRDVLGPQLPQPAEPGRRSPLDQWSVAEASLRLDAMKARIADVTHPWPRVPDPGPDLGGQHLISVYAMRREITDGSGQVRALAAQIASSRSGSGSGTVIPAR